MKVLRAICKFFTWACMLMIVLMMLFMVADVVARVLFHTPIRGATEWVQILLVCNMTAMGAAVFSNRMVKVDMVTSRLKPKAQVILDVVILTVALAATVLVTWQQFVYALKCIKSGVEWTTINVEHWPFIMIFGLGYAVGCLTMAALIVRKIVSLVKGTWEEEAALEDLDPIFAFGKEGRPPRPADAPGQPPITGSPNQNTEGGGQQ